MSFNVDKRQVSTSFSSCNSACSLMESSVHFVSGKMNMMIIITSLLVLPQHILGCTREAKEIGRCLHTFLERDFISMEMVMYPPNKINCDSKYVGNVRLEGPTLESDCKNIGQVLECFLDILKDCQYLEDFFKYRKLVEGLESVFYWTCGDKTELRQRLGDMERHFACIGELTNNHCRNENITENIWNKILRLEEDASICSQLKIQQHCALQERIFDHYSMDAHHLYSNMSDIFLNMWCSLASTLHNTSKFLILVSLVNIIRYCV